MDDYIIEVDVNDDVNDNYDTTLSVYDINPCIQVIQAYVETQYKTSNMWHITGFIDMDYKFFDYMGYKCKFFMKDKSFDLHINIPDFIDKDSIFNCKRINELIEISNIPIKQRAKQIA